MILSKLSPIIRCPLQRNCMKYLIGANINSNCAPIRRFSNKTTESSIAEAKPQSDVSTDVRPLGEKIKESAKTASYTGVIIVGLGVTGIIFYYVFRELFSSSSPNSIYSAALDRCVNDPEVEQALGTPIKGYGEESSRRRRNHVSHAFYQRDGVNCIRMQFYLKGTRREGTVNLDMIEVDGKYEYRYLIVDYLDFSQKAIILEDNRARLDKKPVFNETLSSLPNIL